ncbi:MAG: PaaI family thioesterase [Bacteroidota bacterium]|nr:PaaI family thioesterase [Bacteroidota bacterium]
MKLLKNPYRKLDGYDCFGCSANNPIGLQMEFYEDGEELVSRWNPGKHYQGFQNILHGGIQATLMDEIASWTVQIKLKTAGVTSRLNVRYRDKVLVTEKYITLRAKITGIRRNLADVDVKLFDSEGRCCAEASAIYFTFPEEVARKRLNYPEYEDFYRD